MLIRRWTIFFYSRTLLTVFPAGTETGETENILAEVFLHLDAQLNAHGVTEMKEEKKDEVIFRYKAVARVH